MDIVIMVIVNSYCDSESALGPAFTTRPCYANQYIVIAKKALLLSTSQYTQFRNATYITLITR